MNGRDLESGEKEEVHFISVNNFSGMPTFIPVFLNCIVYVWFL